MRSVSLGALGAGEWGVPALTTLLKATASGAAEISAFEIDLVRKGRTARRLVLNAMKLDHGDAGAVRVLLSAHDVTNARLNERLQQDMLRDKSVLLQELQHRIANSLQIIASVLMQSARRVQSAESRGHLQDAHQRVLSVAAVQKHLAVASLSRVALRTYFTDLCQSLGASMIADPALLSISVDVDDSFSSPEESVSLGLMVTELVINALKHAFPAQRSGRIVVAYHSAGTAWTLSVSDDGVGFPPEPINVKPGLGTSIIEALAKQLLARVVVTDTRPGTMVAISHDPFNDLPILATLAP